MSVQRGSLAVVLRKPLAPVMKSEALEAMSQYMGVKEKTAYQILENIPLKVYSGLDLDEARVLVEALNLLTPCQWEVMSEKEIKFASVSWNKKPTLMGKELAEVVDKNRFTNTGLDRFIGELKANPGPKTERKSQSVPTHVEDEDGLNLEESSIIRSADSVVRGLSEDLEEAYRKKVLKQPSPDETMSPPAFFEDSQNVPGQHRAGGLDSGLYNIYLPKLRSREQREVVEELCQDLLGWSESDVNSALSKPIVCISRNTDDVDASKLQQEFSKRGIELQCKKRSAL